VHVPWRCAGLEVYAQLDTREYPKGIEVSHAELATVNLQGDEFHPEWNYVFRPGRQSRHPR
jgi:hypothetical protein